MSGIFGIVHLDGRSASRTIAEGMDAALAHRGGDARGVWVGERVALGHRLLATTPESLGERQPIVWRAPEAVLVADARVDNRADLIGQLDAADTASDAELILAAYLRWGEDCSSRIVGDFAFAIWDSRSRSLFCARDPMGVRPLYYFATPSVFVFASEIKALFCSGEVARRVDELQVARFLEADLRDREATLFSGVRRLPAAHALRVAERVGQPTRYWRLEEVEPLHLDSTAAYVEAFTEVFYEAVRCRMRSISPVGSALSGGLDSSSIACAARNILAQASGGPVQTFSATFTGLPETDRRLADESPFIDAVLATGGFRAHRFAADRSSPLRDFERMAWHLDQAPLAYNLYMHWGLFSAAQQAGVRVFLDGFDGDGCVSHGYERLDALLRAGDWETFDHQLRRLAQVQASDRPQDIVVRRVADSYGSRFLLSLLHERRLETWARATGELHHRFGVPRRRLVVRHGVLPLLSTVSNALGLRRGRAVDPASILTPELAARLASHPSSPQSDALEMEDIARAAHIRVIDNPLFQYGLELSDLSRSAFQVESRFPFFDRRLLEFCVSLPASEKLDDGWNRVVLRRAMEGILPPSVQWRPVKQNLSPNFRRGLMDDDRAFLEEAMTRLHLIRPYVDERKIEPIWRRFRSPEGVKSADLDAPILYRVASMTQWLSIQADSTGQAT